jgi:HEAT repeat protein
VVRDVYQSYDPDQRRERIAAIAARPTGGAEPYLKMYRKLLIEGAPTVQAASARALGMHGKIEDAPRLAKVLDHANAFVRWEAARSLQRIHNPEVIEPLIDTLQEDADADVRMAAAKALGQYPQPAVFDALVASLGDTNYGVVQRTREALRTLTGHQAPANATVWLNWADSRRGNLFENQQRYTYMPYPAPASWLNSAVFWRDLDPAQRRVPRGLADREDTGFDERNG